MGSGQWAVGRRQGKGGENNMVEGFKGLIAWRKAYALVLEIYKASKAFPREELYGLTSQIRRASVSVIANISEGYDRGHNKQYAYFLLIAKGSLGEVETYLFLSKDLGYIDQDTFNKLESMRNETIRLLNGLIKSLARH